MEKKNIWPGSVLRFAEAETITETEDQITLSTREGELSLSFRPSQLFLMTRTQGEEYVLVNQGDHALLKGHERGWILPACDQDGDRAIEIRAKGEIRAEVETDGIRIRMEDQECRLIRHESRPHADFFGNRYEFTFESGDVFAESLAGFYWGTLLPCVIEKTRAASYPDWRGYVVSTLQPGEYAGTYPDVDHEFQCKGRIALAGGFELEVVKRMMELQFRVMREDPIGLWRNPCSIQPDGKREYHIRRNSMDGSANAEMFLVTGNIEVLETAWLYTAATKDRKWLEENIENLEGAASLVEYLTDRKGRLWSDVFYEDQVMKDGMECMSAAMAANAYGKLAELEGFLGRNEREVHYRGQEKLLADAMIRPVPDGFWDEEKKRFVDWIDRAGNVHDHIHLLANSLPVLFFYASGSQSAAVDALIRENIGEFQRFPTFLAAHIENYTDDEIGDGGPYDLCAAGRYWCWDAAYWAEKEDGAMLHKQLLQVAEQAKIDHYKMGERYDMNHVYYISDKNWHGAPYYYEYPCVFSWVLIHDYLGISPDLEVDLRIAPRIQTPGNVRLDSYRLEYEYTKAGFRLENNADIARTFRVFLGGGDTGRDERVLTLAAGESVLLQK